MAMTMSETTKSEQRKSVTRDSCKVCNTHPTMSASDTDPGPEIDPDIQPYDYPGCLDWDLWHRATPSLFEEPEPPEHWTNKGDRAPTEAKGPFRNGEFVLATRVQGAGADPGAVAEYLISSEHCDLEEVR